MKWLFIIWLILIPAAAEAQVPTATPTPTGATCTITGRVFNPDGSPLVNGTVQFNSVVEQTLQGGAVIPPKFASTTTDANGNIGALALIQGLQGAFTFCSPSAGGCGNPTPVLIPIASTADISSILIGIQLSSGGQVVASSLDVTGNATIGGTLQVAGQTNLSTLQVAGTATFGSQATFNGGSCFPDGGCWNNTGIVAVTHVGIGQWPSLSYGVLQAGETAIDSGVGAPDSLGTNVNMNYASGVHYDTTGAWIADATYPMIYNQVSNASIGPEQSWQVYGPQTVGQPYVFNNRVQYFAVRANVPGVGAGLFIESGGIDVLNGGITANGGTLGTGIWSSHSQNNATFVQSFNGDNNDGGAVAVLRASNGLFVTDLAMTGGQANLGGFFSANRGYVASDAPNGLLLEATGAGGGAELYLSAPNANKIRVIGNGHFMSGTDGYAPPTVGACGGGGQSQFPTNTDMSGWIYVGGTATTSCLMTFGAAWPSTPQCFCNAEALTWCQVTPSTSGISMNFGAPLAGTWVDYWCTGNE